MVMNRHLLSRSHSRSTLYTVSLYTASSRANIRYPRPRTHMSHSSSHSHTYQDSSRNPYAAIPPMLQKVYILDCSSCDTFLTNRGMRAVLLLQPDVPLYSTDALPVNCSVTPGPLEYAPPHESVAASASSYLCPSGIPAPVPRTCECLTQTLCCHGCGNAVGYMVVIPCNLCSSTVSPTNRPTNSHRFVFFHREIVASERHYIPHEPGIITSSPPLVSAMTPSSSTSPSTSFHNDPSIPYASRYNVVDMQYLNHPASPTPLLPTPPPESQMSINYSQPPHAFRPAVDQHHFPSFQFVTLKPERGKLRAGDLVYWHNLSRNGEIPAVVEDERARESYSSIRSPWAGR